MDPRGCGVLRDTQGEKWIGWSAECQLMSVARDSMLSAESESPGCKQAYLAQTHFVG